MGSLVKMCPYFAGGSTSLLLLLIFFFNTIHTVNSDVTSDVTKCSTCIKFNSTCYNVSHVIDLKANFRNTVVIHKMIIVKHNNLLIYSYEPILSDPEYNKIAFVDIENPERTSGVIFNETQTYNFTTLDVNQETGMAYLGGDIGVYEFDTRTYKDIFNLNTIPPSKILAVFFGTTLFYVDNENGTIMKDNELKPYINETYIKDFVISKEGIIVFLNNKGLFAKKSPFQNEVVQLSQNRFFRGMAVDAKGEVYAWWINNIYKVVIEPKFMKSKLVRVTSFPNLGTMTFDSNNNVLLTSGRSLYRLSLTNSTDC